MHINDLDAMLDAPGGPIPNVPLLWYDSRDPALKERLYQLKKAKPFYKRWYSGLLVLAAGPGLTALLENKLVLGLGGFGPTLLSGGNVRLIGLLWFAICAITYVVCVIVIHRKRKRLIKHLRFGVPGRKQGEVTGKAIMLSSEPAWQELNAAFQPYGRSLRWLFDSANPERNRAATPLVAKYLVDTYMERGRLHVRDGDRELRRAPNHAQRCADLVAQIRTAAVETADEIMKILGPQIARDELRRAIDEGNNRS